MTAFYGILLPFIGTVLGAGCVFFLKISHSLQMQRALTGFAAVGFWLGILFLLILDRLIPHLHRNANQPEGVKSGFGRTTMMLLAVTLHNIPEGMAVGVVYAGFLTGSGEITATGTLALSLGIAIQNFPEGAIISMPLRAEGNEEGTCISKRCPLRYRGTAGSVDDDSCSTIYYSCPAVSVELCCRSDALCSGGRTYTGNVSRKTLQHWHGIFRTRLQRDDGTGCGVGITNSTLL